VDLGDVEMVGDADEGADGTGAADVDAEPHGLVGGWERDAQALQAPAGSQASSPAPHHDPVSRSW
jgi:hypothetical protein